MIYKLYILLIVSLVYFETNAQCQSVAIVDSSFEDATFPIANPWGDPWIWFQTDGAELSNTEAYTGTYSVCSIAGGPVQFVEVDSNTNYFLSCFVKNGASDLWGVYLIFDWGGYEVNVGTDNWTFISMGFNSGPDTIVAIGAQSASACFDDFRLTCESLVGSAEVETAPFLVLPTISSEGFTIDLNNRASLKIIDLRGNIVKQLDSEIGKVTFGENLPPGMYFILYSDLSGMYSQRITKL